MKPKPKIDKAKISRVPEALRFTVTGWAKLLGRDPKTIAQRMRSDGHNISKHALFDLGQVLAAVYGDEQLQRTRNLTLDALRKEREEREAAGDLVSRELMEKEIAEFYTLPITQALNSLPTSLDTLVNPTDPELARTALLRWVEETKNLLREKLPK